MRPRKTESTKIPHSLKTSSSWIKVPVIVILAVIPVIVASKVFPTGEVGIKAPIEEFTSHLDQRIPAIMEDYEIPGLAVALIQKGETVWKRAYGHADVEAGRKMTTETYCRLESISKSATAWGVMKLVEAGRIDLDTPVEKYIGTWEIPETEFTEEGVTVRRLLSGSSGMPLGTIGKYYSPNSEDKPALKEILTDDAVLFREPGSAFYYSNTGFNILELMIEEVTGRDFADYMEEEVLLPLGMAAAGFEWSEDFDPPVANGYDMQGTAIPVYVYPDRAAGGLFGTLEAVARFASAGMTDFTSEYKSVLDGETIEEMYSPVSSMTSYYSFVFDGYGLGHFIEFLPAERRGVTERDSAKAAKAVSHGGQGSGWMTDFHSIPETGDGIVILSNSQRTWPGFAYILSDWAKWLGYSSIGMGVIVSVQKGAWIFIAIGMILLLWRLWHLTEGLLIGSRHLAPASETSRLLRLIQFILSMAFAGTLLWIKSLDYWFIDSVLPIAGGWLNFLLLLAAVVLLFSSLLPKTEVEKEK